MSVTNPTSIDNENQIISNLNHNGPHGLTGIVNSGNTCYMSSAIQAFSHNYLLTSYLFNNEADIHRILKTNAKKIFKCNDVFRNEFKNEIVPLSLRTKINSDNYDPALLTEEESNIIYNYTITGQLIKLLKRMWTTNCVVTPISFRKIFSEARNKFFYGYEQQDAEEAYSCILQQMQEELSEEKKNFIFNTSKQSVKDLIFVKNKIIEKIKTATSNNEKIELLNQYNNLKKKMPSENLVVESFREMRKYYTTSYSKIGEIFSGFLHSSLSCPQCSHKSNRFEAYCHISLPVPYNGKKEVNITDCMKEYSKVEILDEKNLWNCEECKNKVRALKKIELWTCPPVLVIQLKRFGVNKYSKDNRMVNYPLDDLDISDMISDISKENGLTKFNQYKLNCVINHKGGSINDGHYYTYCLDDDTNEWYYFNDHMVYEINKNEIINETAYILFYLRKDLIVSN